MKAEYIIQRQGKSFVLYEGLLDEAHQHGLRRISTSVVQLPTEANGNMAVCHAEVETDRGTFSGIGDASPGNVNRMIIPHLLRMSETRAKARALRDAVNVGATAVEELGDFEEDERPRQDSKPASNGHARVASGNVRDFPGSQDDPRISPPTDSQRAMVAKLSRLLGKPEELPVTANRADASDRITELSREYNELKRTARPGGPAHEQSSDFAPGNAVAEKPARADQRRYTPEQMASAPRPGASDEQKDRLWALSGDLGITTRPDELDGLTYADASRRIVDMEIALSKRSQESAGTPDLAPVDAEKAHLLDEVQQRAKTADETRTKGDYQDQWPLAINRLSDATGKPVGKLINEMCRELNLMSSISAWTREEYAAAFAWVGAHMPAQKPTEQPATETV